MPNTEHHEHLTDIMKDCANQQTYLSRSSGRFLSKKFSTSCVCVSATHLRAELFHILALLKQHFSYFDILIYSRSVVSIDILYAIFPSTRCTDEQRRKKAGLSLSQPGQISSIDPFSLVHRDLITFLQHGLGYFLSKISYAALSARIQRWLQASC